MHLHICIPDVFFCFALLSKSLPNTELVGCWFCVLEAAQCSTSLQLCSHCTAVLEPHGSMSAHIQQHCAPARLGAGFPADHEPAHVRAVMWAPGLARHSLSPHGSSPSFFLLSHRGVCSIEDKVGPLEICNMCNFPFFVTLMEKWGGIGSGETSYLQIKYNLYKQILPKIWSGKSLKSNVPVLYCQCHWTLATAAGIVVFPLNKKRQQKVQERKGIMIIV